MKIVIAGPKGSGKSALGKALGSLIRLPVVDTDERVERLYQTREGPSLTCREIFVKEGERSFRELEKKVVEEVQDLDWQIIATGGALMMDPDNRRALRRDAIVILLTGDMDTLWQRATAKGVPPWLAGPDGREVYENQARQRMEVLRPYADIMIETSQASPADLARAVMAQIADELAVRNRAGNTYGEIIQVTTFGESHGPAIGAILDGVAPGVAISEEDIQVELDRRRPGQSKVVTQRNEKDRVHILSGIFEGKTTGAPIAMVIYNEDQDSSKYEAIRELFRPGHADFSFYRKYGRRDHRGGGRSSGRETATRVMGGAVALKILRDRGVRFVAHAVEVAGIRAECCDYDVIESNPVRCADPEAAKAMEAAILEARKQQDSVGGIVQLDILGVPAGLGDPVFGKLDARLSGALMSIGAIKGIEFGLGFELARMRGSAANDGMRHDGFISNNAGGIIGGISTGEPIRLRVVVKPTSSIVKEQQTVNTDQEDVTIQVHGRHDPCIVPRAIPVVESMAALVVLDTWAVQERLRPDWQLEPGFKV